MRGSSATNLAAPILIATDVKCRSISSAFVTQDDARFDAVAYGAERFEALSRIQLSGLPTRRVDDLVGTIWHPVQTQARSNFKRIYTARQFGDPYVGSREMFFFPLRPEKFLSRAFPKLQELRVPRGWLLISRSGTVGNVLYCSDALSQCLITDHAIRIEPTKIPAGYLYAFLASKYGRPLLLSATYGSTVSELEPKHVAELPVPIASESDIARIDGLVKTAYSVRDRANLLIEKADRELHRVLGLAPFDEGDIEFLGGAELPRAFSASSGDLGGLRLDASHHLPLARSAVHKLAASRYQLCDLRAMVDEIYLAPRFARIYVPRAFGIPLLQGSHVPLGTIHDLKFISASQTERIERWVICSGTVLVTCSGTIGRVGIVTEAQAGWAASQHILRVIPKRGVSHEGFLATFLRTPFGQHQLNAKIYGGVVSELTAEDAEVVKIPCVPYEVQQAIGEPARQAYEMRDEATALEQDAIAQFERLVER